MEALKVIDKLCGWDMELNLAGEESFKFMLETSKGLNLLQKLLTHPNTDVW